MRNIDWYLFYIFGNRKNRKILVKNVKIDTRENNFTWKLISLRCFLNKCWASAVVLSLYAPV